MRKLIRSIKNWYYDLRIQYKLTLTHLVIVLIPMVVLGGFFYNRLYDMIVADTIRTEQTRSSNTAPLIEEAVNQVVDANQKLQSLDYIHDLSRLDTQEDLDNLLNTDNTQQFRQEVDSLIDGELITDIRLYANLPSSDPIFQDESLNQLIQPGIRASGTYWNGIFQGRQTLTALHCPSFYLSRQEIDNYGGLAYITKFTILYQGEPRTCYAAVYYSQDYINQLLINNLPSSNSVSYLINERDSIVASSDPALAGTYHFGYEEVEDFFMSSNSFIQKTVVNEEVYAGFYNISPSNWYMIVAMPSRPMIQRSTNLMTFFVLIYLACLVIALVIATILSHSITRRISTVINQMSLVRVGPPKALPTTQSKDEVGDLIESYNYMTGIINQLLEDQSRASEELRIAEFNALQAQINPHFLYNTMDMINWLSQQGRTEEVTQAIHGLSRFYKLTLSRKNNISTLADEVEHVSIYIQLQNMRFNNAIEFVVDVPDTLADYHIPKLTFQPVVENAILHGILEKENKEGTILLTAWQENEDLIILISDDGVGIPPEKLKTILSGQGTSKTGSNIAIYNTHRRLQTLYGTRYGLSYSSTLGTGTEVEIRIPALDPTQKQDRLSSPVAHIPLPLVAVSGNERLVNAAETVSPQTLLRYNQQLTQNTFQILNLHQISSNLPAGEQIYILSHQITEDFPAHTHAYFEITYVCQGSFTNILDGRKLLMSAGDMVVMNPQVVQEIKRDQDNALVLNICLQNQLFQGPLKGFYESSNPLSDFLRQESDCEANYIFYSLGHSLQAQSLITSIIQEYTTAGFHETSALDGLFLLFFDQLANTKEYSYYGSDAEIQQILKYCRENCLTSTTAQLAEQLGYTESQLKRHVKKYTGLDIKQIIRDQRLNHAVSLLGDPTLNIYQIAELCGYHNMNKFFGQFESHFGVTPEEYRKRLL